jgi:hypothetical protein
MQIPSLLRLLTLSVTCLDLPYFSMFFHKRHDFREGKKDTEHKVCVFISLQTLSETFLILRRLEQSMSVRSFSSKGPVIFPDFNGTWVFRTDFRKILKYKILWKSVHWGPSCFMRADERADLTKFIVASRIVIIAVSLCQTYTWFFPPSFPC